MSDPFLADLALARRERNTPTSDRAFVDLRDARGDLALVDGRANLAQALLNRLYTRRGALASTGHPDYGSRLYQIVGEPDSRRTRALADFYIREALGADPRVAEVTDVVFEAPPRNSPLRNALQVRVVVLPAGGGEPMTLSLSAALEG